MMAYFISLLLSFGRCPGAREAESTNGLHGIGHGAFGRGVGHDHQRHAVRLRFLVRLVLDHRGDRNVVAAEDAGDFGTSRRGDRRR